MERLEILNDISVSGIEVFIPLNENEDLNHCPRCNCEVKKVLSDDKLFVYDCGSVVRFKDTNEIVLIGDKCRV